jgi:hypothetical protein
MLSRSTLLRLLLGVDALLAGGVAALLLVRQLLLTDFDRSISVVAQDEILNVLDHLIPYFVWSAAGLALALVATLTAWAWSRQWVTRGASLAVASFDLLIISLVLTNEDPPRPEAWAVIGCLGLTLAAMAAAWRWPRRGGQLVLASAELLGPVALGSGLITGVGWAALLAALAYAVPVAAVGALFWAAGDPMARGLSPQGEG